MIRRLVAVLGLLLLVALPAGAASIFASTVAIPMSTRAGNTYNFSSVAVQTDVKGLTLTIDLSEAPDPPTALPAMSGSLECSQDGGTTWQFAGGFTRGAGPKVNNKEGNLQTTTGGSFQGGPCWSDTQNTNRRLRGSATIGGTLRFALTVQPL